MAEKILNFPLKGSGLARGGNGPHDPTMQAQIDRLNHAVERIDNDLTAIKVSVGRIEERMTHMPTKLWIAGWGLLGLVATVGVLWRIVAALLDSQGAHIAAEVMKAASK